MISQSLQKILNNKVLSSGFFLIAATMFANLLNFVFNAYLGRQLSPANFGTVTLINTIIYLATILITSVSSTVNHETAYLEAKKGSHAGVSFLDNVKKHSIYISLFLSVLWIILTPAISHFFNIDNTLLILYCTPFIFCGVMASVYRGFIQGNFLFSILAILIALEAFIKLVLAGILVRTGWSEWVAISIPFSIVAAFFVAWFYGERIRNKIVRENHKTEEIPFAFPHRFYLASVLTGLSTAVFLSMDVILVKHYFDPIIAGQYSLLSLIGKIIFFLGSLLNIFIITLVSGDEGKGKNPHENFYKIFLGTLALLALAFIFVGPLGSFVVPLLLGAKALPILPYVSEYAIGTALFTIAGTIITFHLARKEYLFSVISLLMSGIFSLGIVFFHNSVLAVVHVFVIVSLANLFVVAVLHFMQRIGTRIANNLRDLWSVFKPLPEAEPKSATGKNILIFNWRDRENVYAGGAELYIHEVIERLVAEGHSATLFCGNDGTQEPNGVSNGMRIIRRGGFFGVYLCAIVYYLFKFRGKFDVIIDCENGVPFFTPLYAKERIYILLHHVHQDVFYKYLPKPAAFFAATLEKHVMPFVYKNTEFITVSESSKQDMTDLKLSKKNIHVVNPGVDFIKLFPGEKSPAPVIFSVGRIKAYKSLDVLIKAFQTISHKLPTAQLVIAGDGDARPELELLTEKLKLENRVTFLGKISEEEKISWLQKAWVFVNPSMMEGWGITSIEANACGTPVVAANVPGLRDSVQNPHTGFLVPYGDHDAFADKITLICTDSVTRGEMNTNAREWAQNFNWNKLSEKFRQIIFNV